MVIKEQKIQRNCKQVHFPSGLLPLVLENLLYPWSDIFWLQAPAAGFCYISACCSSVQQLLS